MRKAEQGFTLLEVLVATVIMGIAVAGLIAGLSQSAKNASRLTDYDRAAMLARGRMNELLLDANLPFEGNVEGPFTRDQSGGIPSGWRATLKPFDSPPERRSGDDHPFSALLSKCGGSPQWRTQVDSTGGLSADTNSHPGHQMKKNRQAGVTLLEMIVAVSLLSLLSAGMLIAMRLGFNTMDKVNSHLILDRRVVNSRGIIENEISGFMFTMADFMPGSPGFRSVPFIEAAPQSMRFCDVVLA